VTILVFDSGIGGLSVLREARVLMPEAHFTYVADDAAFSYGDWQQDELRHHIVNLFETLVARFKPELVIIACNTASTLVLEDLRQAFPGLPFVGTVPAIKPAAERTASGLVSVLATPGTVERDYTKELIRSFAGQCHVQLVGSHKLSAMAEAQRPGTTKFLKRSGPVSLNAGKSAPILLCLPARIIRFYPTVSAVWHPGPSTGSTRRKRLPGAP